MPRSMASGASAVRPAGHELGSFRTRVVHPCQHVHQRALAGAVFAQQGMDFACTQVEIDVIICQDAGEAHDYALHLDGERGF